MQDKSRVMRLWAGSVCTRRITMLGVLPPAYWLGKGMVWPKRPGEPEQDQGPTGSGIRVEATAQRMQDTNACRYFWGMPMPERFDLDRLPTPIGTALLITDADGLLRALDWEDHEPRMQQLLRLHYGAVNLQNASAPRDLRTALTGYFNGDLDRLAAIGWRVAGTPFQQKVWKALPGIAAGTTLGYGALAARLGMPRAVRALGHANGSNPISVVLPCHRLVGANGSLVKYGGGLERKRWLLRHEGVAI
jgi:methylated-DNA-[protein]-cysteine S-methyltransferase